MSEAPEPKKPRKSARKTDGREETQSAVTELFGEHNRTLVSFLAMRLHSVSEAKEVAQEAYVRVLQLDKPGASSFLRAYLFRVASNLAIDRLRRRATQHAAMAAEPFAELTEDRRDPERVAIAREQILILARCLEELPEKCRRAFLMYRLDELSQAEIAKRLEISDRMVRTYIKQAMVHCRMRLEEGMPAGGTGAAEKDR